MEMEATAKETKTKAILNRIGGASQTASDVISKLESLGCFPTEGKPDTSDKPQPRGVFDELNDTSIDVKDKLLTIRDLVNQI